MASEAREIHEAFEEIYKSEGKHHGAREVAEEFMELAMGAFQSGDDDKAKMYRDVAGRINSMAHRMSVEHNEKYRASGIETAVTNRLARIVDGEGSKE